MRVQRDGRGFTVDVDADGDGLVSRAGAALLAEVADRVGLTRELSRALAGCASDAAGTIRSGLIRDLAVMLADGGDCLSDLRAVRDQQPLFGPVASNSTAFGCDRIANDPGLLDAVRRRALGHGSGHGGWVSARSGSRSPAGTSSLGAPLLTDGNRQLRMRGWRSVSDGATR